MERIMKIHYNKAGAEEKFRNKVMAQKAYIKRYSLSKREEIYNEYMNKIRNNEISKFLLNKLKPSLQALKECLEEK